MKAIKPKNAISILYHTIEVDEIVMIRPNIPVNPQINITAWSEK